VKIRIQGDSVRCRLGRRELAELLSSGELRSQTRFPGSVFEVRLGLPTGATPDFAQYVAGSMEIQLSPAAFRAWAVADEESYPFEVPLDQGHLSVLIEKDFPCDTRTDCAQSTDLFNAETLRLDDETDGALTR